jgi:hypothetical protein
MEWEDYAAEKGRELYLRNLSEVVTSAFSSPSSFSPVWLSAHPSFLSLRSCLPIDEPTDPPSLSVVAFLGWLSILHWGPNTAIYPFFAFDSPDDPYTYRLTLTASLIIFAAELFSSWIARAVCWMCYGVDVTNVRASLSLPYG